MLEIMELSQNDIDSLLGILQSVPQLQKRVHDLEERVKRLEDLDRLG